MPGMANGAVDFSVAAGCLRPFGENLLVAAGADSGLGIRGKADFQGLVGRMALGARGLGLSFIMRLMAFGTLRNPTMFLAVTVLADLLAVGTRKLPQLGRLVPMANGTVPDKNRHGESLARCMGVFVTALAIDLLVPMGRIVAIGTMRHDFGKIISPWIVGMEDLVAIPAVETVSTPMVPQVPELTRMATPALGHRHRFGRGRIKIVESGCLRAALFCGRTGCARRRSRRLRGQGRACREKNCQRPDQQGSQDGYPSPMILVRLPIQILSPCLESTPVWDASGYFCLAGPLFRPRGS